VVEWDRNVAVNGEDIMIKRMGKERDIKCAFTAYVRGRFRLLEYVSITGGVWSYHMVLQIPGMLVLILNLDSCHEMIL